MTRDINIRLMENSLKRVFEYTMKNGGKVELDIMVNLMERTDYGFYYEIILN